MKRIIYALMLYFLLAGTLVGVDTYSRQQYESAVNDQFEQTVYLETELDYDSFFAVMERYSQQYHLDIQKVTYTNQPMKNAKQTVNMYILLDDAQRLKNNLALDDAIELDNLQQGEFIASVLTNDVQQKGYFPVLYPYGEIYLRPFIDLTNRQIEGKYDLHMNDASLNWPDIMKAINQEGLVQLHQDNLNQNIFIAYDQSMVVVYRWIILALVFVTLMVVFSHIWNDFNKKIAVKKLFGYTNSKILNDISIEYIFTPLGITAGLTVLGVVGWTVYCGLWKDTIAWQFYLQLSGFYLMWLTLILAGSMLLYSTGYLLLRWRKKQSILLVLKGENKATTIFSQGIKAFSAIGCTTALVFCIISFSLMWEDMKTFSYWENNGRQYASFGLRIPDYILQDRQAYAALNLNIVKIWQLLDENDGVMFYYTKGQPLNDGEPVELNGEAVDIPFAYINSHYLQLNPIVDVMGQPITLIDESNDDVITILVPEQYRSIENYILEKVHLKHIKDRFIAEDVHQAALTGVDSHRRADNQDNPAITEKIIYIQDDQAVFSYNTIHNLVENPVLFCVNGTNMGANVYVPSILGGGNGMKVPYEDIETLDAEMKQLFQSVGVESVDLRYEPLYESKAERISLFRSAFYSSVVLLVLSVSLLLISMMTFIQFYVKIHRRKFATQHILGFSFARMHGIFYCNILVEYGVLCVAVFLIYFVTVQKYTGSMYYLTIILLSVSIAFLDMILSTIALRIEKRKNIISTLKGE